MSANEQSSKIKPNVLDLFVEGARRGFTIGTTSLLPNVVMAFVIIRILDVTGLLKIIGISFAPIMSLWGLPGEAATVAASLYNNGILDPVQVTILVPSIYLMGNPVQNVGRCLGISAVNTRHYAAIIGICIINALLSIWAMRLIVLFS
jgi:spore maturation protein SpmB